MRLPLSLIVGVLLVGGCGVAAPAPAPPPGAAVIVSAPTAPPPSRPMSVSIPALGVVDEVVPVGLNPDRTMQIPPVTAVGWYDLGPIPGQRGPSVLAGHVNYNGAQGAFARIGELKPGDAVLVTATNGAQVKFVIYDVIRYPKSAPNLQAAFGDTTVPELHLITCSGAVREHEYADNTVARARLASA